MIKPAGHRIVVIPDKSDTQKRASASGIIIAEVEAQREQASVDTGIVQSIGATAFKDFGGTAWCAVGDRIAYAKYAGKSIKQGDETFIVLNDEDVVAIMENTNE